MPGVHALAFDSPADTIEITHTARSRDGLALGALRAGETRGGGPKGGVTIDDVLEDILGEL
jgi:4-hydroxy-tetrahydrodipicolinate reductase